MPPATLHPQYIVDDANRKQSVILPLTEYDALLEDLEDLAAVAERREEPAVSHAELLAELKKDGLRNRLDETNRSLLAQDDPGTQPLRSVRES